MKIKRCLFMLAFAVLFAVCGGAAFAQSEEYYNVWEELPHTEMDLDYYSDNLWHLHLQRLDELPDDVRIRKIMSYDVSEKGNILVLYSGCLIAVYDNDFNFIYAISFLEESYHTAVWHGEKVALMPWRGAYALVIDENAVPLAMYDLEASEFEFEEFSTSRTRVHGGYTYFLHDRNESDSMIKYSGISTGRHILERTAANGYKEILFQSPEPIGEKLFEILCIPFLIAVALLIYFFHKKIQGEQSNEIRLMDNNYRPLLKK